MRYSVRWRSMRGGRGSVPFSTAESAAIYHADKVTDLARLAGHYHVETVDMQNGAKLDTTARQ